MKEIGETSRDADNMFFMFKTPKWSGSIAVMCICYRKKNSCGDHRNILKPDAVKMYEDRVTSEMCELKTVSKPAVRAQF